MHHFNDDRRRHVRLSDLAERAGGQRQDRETQMFPAAVQGVSSIGNDLRIEIVHLPDQLLADRLRKGSTGSTICFQERFRLVSGEPAAFALATFDSATSICSNLRLSCHGVKLLMFRVKTIQPD